MSNFPTDSQRLVSDWRARAGGHTHAQTIETRLHQAARHVSAARFGADLYYSDTSQVTASFVLVFGSGQTSIDLCATSLLRWHHKIPPQGREWDFGDLKQQVDGLPLGPAQRAWYDELDSPQADELTHFREAIIHRVVRIDATVRPGWGPNTMTISLTTDAAGNEDAGLVLHRAATFVEDRFRQFVAALGT